MATDGSQRAAVQDVVWELGLEAQIIGNRGALMILPAGINKASGLAYALRKLGLSRHETVAIGDAENDHSLLECCECAVAVANATPSLKENAVFVTASPNGRGVRELIDRLLEDDLESVQEQIVRDRLLLGSRLDGSLVRIAPYGGNILIAGPSGSGKSTLAAGLIERLIENDYQICIVDPEGDYGTLQALRARSGRPHWLVLDEAHHMLPGAGGPADSALPRHLGETLLITVHPEHVSAEILAKVDLVIAIGQGPRQTLEKFAHATSQTLLWPETLSYAPGQVVVWFARDGKPPFAMRSEPGRAERIRHHRKYAEGDLRWHSFFFRGPEGRTNLKAHNLVMFSHLAQGIDEETWLFHLRRGDYSRWFRDCIRDPQLAEAAERIERLHDLAPTQTRDIIRELIQARYTLPE